VGEGLYFPLGFRYFDIKRSGSSVRGRSGRSKQGNPKVAKGKSEKLALIAVANKLEAEPMSAVLAQT